MLFLLFPCLVCSRICFAFIVKYRHFSLFPSSWSAFFTFSHVRILFQDGMLAHLKKLTSVALSRNYFDSFPLGGPQQFTSVQVRNSFLSFFFVILHVHFSCLQQRWENFVSDLKVRVNKSHLNAVSMSIFFTLPTLTGANVGIFTMLYLLGTLCGFHYWVSVVVLCIFLLSCIVTKHRSFTSSVNERETEVHCWQSFYLNDE